MSGLDFCFVLSIRNKHAKRGENNTHKKKICTERAVERFVLCVYTHTPQECLGDIMDYRSFVPLLWISLVLQAARLTQSQSRSSGKAFLYINVIEYL